MTSSSSSSMKNAVTAEEMVRKKIESTKQKIDSEKKESFIRIGLKPPPETEEDVIKEIKQLKEDLGGPSVTILGELKKMRDELKYSKQLKDAEANAKLLP